MRLLFLAGVEHLDRAIVAGAAHKIQQLVWGRYRMDDAGVAFVLFEQFARFDVPHDQVFVCGA